MGQRIWAALLSFIVIMTVVTLNRSAASEKLLLASNFALYDQLKYLAPKDQKVAILVPFGQDSHTFQASPKNITMIVDSVAFFYTSKGMDQWVSKLDVLKTASNMIDLSASIQWIEDEGHNHHHHGAEAKDHDVDPHYWFDFQNQMKTARKVSQTLIELFPVEKIAIEDRLRSYLDGLDKLKHEYEYTLKSCKKNQLFVTHDAFAYLEEKDFFRVESVVGLSPESTPNPARMEKIIENLKKSGVKTIFFENFTSDKIAVAIANEANVSVEVLDTLATISAQQAKEEMSYNDLMQKNLLKISKALECQ